MLAFFAACRQKDRGLACGKAPALDMFDCLLHFLTKIPGASAAAPELIANESIKCCVNDICRQSIYGRWRNLPVSRDNCQFPEF